MFPSHKLFASRSGPRVCVLLVFVTYAIYCHAARADRARLTSADKFAYRYTFRNPRIPFRDADRLRKFITASIVVVIVCYVFQKAADLRRAFREALFIPHHEGNVNGGLSLLSSSSCAIPLMRLAENAADFLDSVITEDGMLDLNRVADTLLSTVAGGGGGLRDTTTPSVVIQEQATDAEKHVGVPLRCIPHSEIQQ